MVASTEAAEAMQKLTMRKAPQMLLRDGPRVQQIRRAASVVQVIDLAPHATGLANIAWHKRMREFGPPALEAIAERLPRARGLANPELGEALTEKLVGALRWHGMAGAQVLLKCFDTLSDYGKSLACVALGLLRAQAAADRMWDFYNQTRMDGQDRLFVGALWGLVDVGDPRAGLALAEQLDRRQDFYELWGLAARGGDARAILPLFEAFTRLPKSRYNDAVVAMITIGHRIGRDALIAALLGEADSAESKQQATETADLLLSKPAEWPQEYFQLFYGGFNAQVVEGLLNEDVR